MVTRTIGWCLDDGRYEAAVKIAEAGRSLVLASVTLAGRVEELLRGSGQTAAADAWRRGDARGRLIGLNGLWATREAGSLLATPTTAEIAVSLLGSTFDAIVYLVPAMPVSGAGASATAGTGAGTEADVGTGAGAAGPQTAQPGRALILRPVDRIVDVLPLPGVVTGPDTLVGRYLTGFDDAVAALAALAPGTASGGFQGTEAGQEWARRLDELGRWAHSHIVGPLVRHGRGWSPRRPPRVALVPLGELAAIPFAAAWTDDAALAGGRRYAMHDLVLTQAVSARLLFDVARRERRDLSERVVFAVDPTGEFPYARQTARALVAKQYPAAEYYGRGGAPNGPATSDVLLAAFPGREQPGASLLHLSTHGRTVPTPGLRTADEWLPLTRILEQSRDRPVNAAGGLIITNACLTDSTRTHFDESLTLATAMLAAGARSVIATRWPIGDDTAAVLTFRLHYHLQMGRPPAEALREAQLDLLEARPALRTGLHPHLAALSDARLAHPAAWAGYVHLGC